MAQTNQIRTTKLWRRSLGIAGLSLTLMACGDAPAKSDEIEVSADGNAVSSPTPSTSEANGDVKEVDYPEFDRSARAERIAALDVDEALGASAFEVCASCHGADGFGSRDGLIPRLAGQHRAVILNRLIEISEGVRVREDMAAYKPAMETDEQIGALAFYIEAMDDPQTVIHGPGENLDRSAELYRDLCSSCHGVNGRGDGAAGFPRIGGWDYGSVNGTLLKLQQPDAEIHETGMSDLVSMLTEAEVSGIADHVSRLTGGKN